MAQTSRLVIELDSRDAEAKAADTRKALEALEGAGLSIQPALNKAGAGMEKMGKGAEKATKSIEDETDELERLLGQIDPVVRRLGELDKQEQLLAKHRKEGKLDKATFDDYQGKISASRAELGRFNADMGKTGISAKQTAAALRGVPAQFTDIATSLQGGQAPLTVFLQQGGQLKDMFGGVGPAAKALGGYVAGLINPFTIAASAIGVFTLAAYKGYEQSEQYRKALTMSGDAAGKTADDLIALSNAIAGGRNFDEASQAVLALAGNGRLTGEAFTQVARAATEMSVATGKSAADIADQLSSTKGSVTDLAAEYSDKYGVITLAVFEQVRALEQQGDRMGAIKVLAGAVADEMGARNKEMVESTRGLARAWDDVKTSVSGVWNELKAGLSASPELFKLQHLQSQLQEAQTIGDKALIAGLERQVSLAQAAVDAQTQKKEGISAEVQEQKALISAGEKWNALTTKEMTEQAKLAKDIAAARKLGVEAGKSQADIDGVVANIQAKYDKAQPKDPKPKAYSEDAGMKMLDAARQANAVLLQQNASISGQGIATQKLGVQAQALIKWEQQLADIKGKQTLTADQKSLLASQEMITAQLKKNAGLEREAEIQKGIKQANDDQVKLLTLTGQLREANSLKSSLDDAAQLAEYERQGNTEAAKRLETLIKIRDINLQSSQKPGTIEGVSQAPQVTGLDASVGGAYSEIQRLNEESVKVDAWRTMELEKQKAYLDLKAINEETYAERVNNINQQGRDNQAKIERAKNSAILTSSADFFGNMAALSESGNKELAAVGKAAAIAQATIQGFVAVQNALAVQPYPLGMALAVSAGVVAAANVASIAGVGFSGGGYTGPGGVNEYAGAVHKGEVVWSQKDIKRSGGVAAVEALRNGNVSAMPSSASAGGANAVASVSGAPPQINIHVNGDGSGGSVSSTEGYEQMGQAVLATVRTEMPKIARAVIQQEKGQNGLLDPSNRRNSA